MVLCSVHCSDCREGGRQELVVLMVPVVLVVLVEVGGGFRPAL